MLAKKYRLTKRGSFRYVYNKGTRSGVGKLSLVFVKSKSLKIGFSVSNKVGCAVVRNKLRRRLRAICRSLIPCVSPVQAVIVARPEAAEMTFAQLEAAVKKLFSKAGLLNSLE